MRKKRQMFLVAHAGEAPHVIWRFHFLPVIEELAEEIIKKWL